jgi:hypothetical protein
MTNRDCKCGAVLKNNYDRYIHLKEKKHKVTKKLTIREEFEIG